jgi:riboflavin biosynthesis pyrimidine reductase
VRRFLPGIEDLEVQDAYAELVLPQLPDRAWVAIGMVATVDGAAAREGATAALGGEADHHAFRALRDACDVVLVGAGTARAEDYGPPRGTPSRREGRRRRGLAATPRLAVVTGSLALDPGARLFGDPDHRPLVFTHAGAPRERRSALAEVADVVECGEREVDLQRVLEHLHTLALGRVLCEGGPSLNGALLALDAVDEVFLTVEPSLSGGAASRIVRSAEELPPRRLELVGLAEHDGELLLRYRRRR